MKWSSRLPSKRSPPDSLRTGDTPSHPVVLGVSGLELAVQAEATLSVEPPQPSTGLIHAVPAALAAGAGEHLASSGQTLQHAGLAGLAPGHSLLGAGSTAERGGQRHGSRQQQQRRQGTAHVERRATLDER